MCGILGSRSYTIEEENEERTEVIQIFKLQPFLRPIRQLQKPPRPRQGTESITKESTVQSDPLHTFSYGS